MKQQTKTPDTTKQKELHIQGTEIQYLQNAADDLGLIVHEKFTQDKRQTIKKYFAQKGNETVSPVLDYEQLNHFLLGYRKAVNERQALLDEIKELKNSFYMNICRAYNAGKQNALSMVAEKKQMGEASEIFQSSHDYFKEEFPEFKTNVP